MTGWDRIVAAVAGLIVGLLVASVATVGGSTPAPSEPVFCQCACTVATAAPPPEPHYRGVY